MSTKRRISPLSLLGTALSGMIGSGWLFGPFYAAKITGPAAIIAWGLGGILMLLIALCFAELSTMFPETGAMGRFGMRSHGPIVGFTMAWLLWLSAVMVAPIETMALMQYAANYLPHLMHKIQGETVLTTSGIGMSAIIMLFMCILNTMGVKWLTRTNNAIVVMKCAIPIVTILMLFSISPHWSNFTAAQGFMPGGWQQLLTALPQAGIIFSFIGYSPAIHLAGEAKHPQRAIPLAILASIGIAIALYIAVQTAFIAALPTASFHQGWSHLTFKGDTGPFAGIMLGLGIAWFAKVLYVDALVSPFGTAFVYTASAARLNVAASEDNFLPKLFLNDNKKGIPAKAIFFNFIVGLFALIPFPSWQHLVSFLISAFIFAYAIGPIALYRLRLTEPNIPRPFRLPYARIIAPMAFTVCNLIVYWAGWSTVWHILIVISVGYLYFIYLQSKQSTWRAHWQDSCWLIPHFVGIGVISYLGAFGGRHIIPFGWDFIALGALSLFIFKYATKPATMFRDCNDRDVTYGHNQQPGE